MIGIWQRSHQHGLDGAADDTTRTELSSPTSRSIRCQWARWVSTVGTGQSRRAAVPHTAEMAPATPTGQMRHSTLDVSRRPGNLLVDRMTQSQGGFEVAWLVAYCHMLEVRQSVAERPRNPYALRR